MAAPASAAVEELGGEEPGGEAAAEPAGLEQSDHLGLDPPVRAQQAVSSSGTRKLLRQY